MKTDPFFKKRIVVITMAFIIAGLLVLLLRENEGRVAAEEKLNDIQYKVTSMKSQKDDVIMDLQSQMTVLQAKLQEEAINQAALVNQKKAEMDALNTQMQQSSYKYEMDLKQREENIGRLSAKSKEDAAQYGDTLKEKNAEIGDLSARLEDEAKKSASLYKKVAKLEAAQVTSQKVIEELQSHLDKSRREVQTMADKVEKLQKPAGALD